MEMPMTDTISNTSTLGAIDKEWDEIQSTYQYKIIRLMGQGSFGTVYET